MDRYLQETRLLDYADPVIQQTIECLNLPQDNKGKILAIYNFVRDDILFGYNKDDAISASQVLCDGYGQCNTKGILLMALLRFVGIPCRIHGFTIDKELQRGAMNGLVYKSAPKEILHSWIEIQYREQWLELEGFILDMNYLSSLQRRFSECTGGFCGYGVATADFQHPQVNWEENNTYIQKEGIVRDFGIFDSPDEFFEKHAQNLSPVKRLLYRHVGRHLMNRNVRKIRNKKAGSGIQ